MDEIEEIVANWRHGMYVAEQWKSEVFCRIIDLLELAVPADETLLQILDEGYRAYIAQLVFRHEGDPDAHDRYCTSRQRVIAALESWAPEAHQPQVGGGRARARVVTPPPSTSRESSKRPAPGEPPAQEPQVEDEQDDGAPVIELISSSERYLGQFRTTFRQETFHVRDLQQSLLENEMYMESLFDSLLQRQVDILKAKENDRCVLELRGDDENRPLWFSLRRVDQLSGRVIIDKLVKTLNSNENFLAGVFHLSFIHVPTLSGGARDRRTHEKVEEWIERFCESKSIYDPNNEGDKMCLARCIAFLQLHRSAKNRSAASRLRNPANSAVTTLASTLCREAGVEPDSECTVSEMNKFQSILKERLVVFLDKELKDIVFCGPKLDDQGIKRERTLFIIQNASHFYAVLRIKIVLGSNYVCFECLKGVSSLHSHRCEFGCKRCNGENLHTESPLIECKACSKFFAGKECLATHLVKRGDGKSICDLKKFCKICQRFYYLDGKTKMKKHKCNYKICTYCKEYVPSDHRCHMTPWEEKKKAKTRRYLRVYFDIETRQDDSFEGKDNWKEHKANLLVCQQVCDDCEKDKNILNDCEFCGKREHVFQGFDKKVDVISDFLEYLFGLCSEKNTHITLFAHNMKNFDGVIVLQSLLEKGITPKVKLAGAKILSMKTESLHFKDSIMFLPQRLANLPKSFGLTEMKKGYFCHLANNENYYNFCGAMPPKELYCCSSFSDKELVEFNSWYDKQIKENYVFDFKKEIIEYCRSDVNILRESMEIFKELFMETAHFDPLFNCITLSSACMCNFRRNHLGSSSLGIVPRGGYRGRDKASFIALKWLSYEEHVLGQKITHAENSREVVVLNHPVDGYAVVKRPDGSEQRTIWNFHGCMFHCCLSCIPDEASRSRIRGLSKEDPYERTKRMAKKYRDAGYFLIEKWECEFQRDLKTNDDVINFFKNNPFRRTEPLNLRDAICGGRTSALYSEYTARLDRGEKIKFFDVISEYPSVQHLHEFPEGHPAILCEGDPDMPELDDMNGVVKVTVLPPKNLFLPVLPYKCCKKLLFPLCKTCAETLSQDECHHDDKERELLGTWCAPELKLAVKKGYDIKIIHECYQYPNVRKFNPKTKQDGLFSSYVRENMAMKIQASGFPIGIDSDEQKDAFIQKHFQRDGIVLDKSKFQKNSGRRTLAKLILNSFWGKLGERTLRPQTEFVKKYADLVRLTEDSTISISSLIPLGENVLQVTYTPHSDMEDSYPTTSLVHAAFTTAYGRLTLYNYLSIVDERALYHDTDSICFISRDNLPEPPLGEYLGCLSDQLADDYGEGSFCTEFVSAGAKNYAYRVAVGGDLNQIKTVVKVRGLTINSSCSNIVTFDRLKAMVRGEYEKTIVPIPAQIARVSKWRIVTRESSKVWRVCLTKRRRVENQTVPYGFVGELMNDDDYDCLAALDNLMT